MLRCAAGSNYDSDEGDNEGGVTVLDGLEATLEDLDEEQVRGEKPSRSSEGLVHRGFVRRRVFDRVDEGIARADVR